MTDQIPKAKDPAYDLRVDQMSSSAIEQLTKIRELNLRLVLVELFCQILQLIKNAFSITVGCETTNRTDQRSAAVCCV